MSNSSRSRTRLGAAAGLLGALAALTGLGPVPSAMQLAGSVEDVSGNCDEAEHAADAACAGTASTTLDTGSSTTMPTTPTTGVPAPAVPASAVRTFQAGTAGSVEVAVDSTGLRLLTTRPSQGWTTHVDQATGREIEVTFRSGTLRVDLNLELEDGQVRERIRTRDDATDVRTETITGVLSTDDNSGPGSDDDDDVDVDDDEDDNSGPGSDDDDEDEDDNSGPGSDDGPGHD